MKIKECLEHVVDNRGKTPPTSESGYFLVEINAITGRKKYPDYSMVKKFVTEETFNHSFRSGHPKAGDILIPTVGTLDAIAVNNRNDICIAQNLIALRANSKVCDGDYLYYLLRDKNTRLRVLSLDIGSVQPSIKVPHLLNLEIELPDLNTQRIVSKFLSQIDKKIDLNDKANQLLEEQAKLLFDNWFISYKHFGGTLPSDWREGRFDEIANFQNGYSFTGAELIDHRIDDSYQVFKQGHIMRGGGFNPEGTKSWYPKSLCSKLNKYILCKGDLLMAMTDMKGNVAILGNTAIMPVSNQYILNQRVGLIRPNNELGIYYPYVYLLTNYSNFLHDLRSRANSGVQVNLSSNAIKETKVLIAPKYIYEEFNKLVEPLFEKILSNITENKTLMELRDTLLPKLVSGTLDASKIETED